MKRLFVIAVLFLAACARHDDLPPALNVMEPPVPTNLTINTEDFISFELSWEVDDPSIVSYYRIYASTVLTEPAPLDTTVFTSITIVTEDNLPIRGVTFCVSSITTENVESSLACKPVE